MNTLTLDRLEQLLTEAKELKKILDTASHIMFYSEYVSVSKKINQIESAIKEMEELTQ